MTRCLLSACITNCSNAGWFWKRKIESVESKPRAHHPAPLSATSVVAGRNKQLQQEVYVVFQLLSATSVPTKIERLRDFTPRLQDSTMHPQAIVSLATLHIRKRLAWEDKRSDAIRVSSKRHLIQFWIFPFSSLYNSITTINTTIISYQCSVLLYHFLRRGAGNGVWPSRDHFQSKTSLFTALSAEL